MKQKLSKLKKEEKGVNHFKNFEEYMSSLTKTCDAFFNDPMTSKANIKNFVMFTETLTKMEKNKIFYLHNVAVDDPIYGSQLYEYCIDLVKKGKVTANFPNKIYVLSIDWPLHIAINPIVVDYEDNGNNES